jgi:hypothetical protein
MKCIQILNCVTSGCGIFIAVLKFICGRKHHRDSVNLGLCECMFMGVFLRVRNNCLCDCVQFLGPCSRICAVVPEFSAKWCRYRKGNSLGALSAFYKVDLTLGAVIFCFNRWRASLMKLLQLHFAI